MLQTMKQRYKKNNIDFSTTCSSFYKEEEEEEDELEVAEILLQLHYLISKYDTSPPLLSWGVKRKRSALDLDLDLDWNPSSPHLLPLTLNHVSVFVEEEQPNPNPMKKKKKKIESSSRRSSPATPLSFSPSESDSIRKPYKRKLSTNKKKTKEEWQTDVIMLADQQDTLKKELRKVMDYYENLKAKNLELKLTLQKVKNHFHQKDLSAPPNFNSSCNGKGGLEQQQPSSSPVPPPEQKVPMFVYQQQPNIIEQQQKQKCIRSTELLENSRYSYNQQLMPPPASHHPQFGVVGTGFRGMDQNANPLGLPDLNFTDAASTVTAAAAAAARGDETTTNSSNGFEHPNPNYNYIHQQQQQQQQQHWLFESSLNNRAAAEARRRRMEEMRKGKRSMDSVKTRCR